MEKRRKETYRKQILEKYQLEKEGELSPYLFEPTPSSIKEACLVLFDKRNSAEDIKILRRFFKPKAEENILSSIEKIDINKFRPIVTFLKGGRTTPKDPSLELASWLVDFKPRPFINYIQWNGNGDSENGAVNQKYSEDKNVEKRTLERSEKIEIKKKKEKKKRRWIITISLSIAFGAILITTPLLKELLFTPLATTTKPTECMTWADSEYIKVSCDMGPLSKFGTEVKPMRVVEFKNMKKVKVTASYNFFTEDGKPLIWYYKNRNKEIEYYTSPGLHPTNGETLRKITPHIIETYVPIHSDIKESFIEKSDYH